MPDWYNLTDAQATTLARHLRPFARRPTPREYDKLQSAMEKVRNSKLRPELISRVRAGTGEAWSTPLRIPLPGFTVADLPPGMALNSIYDSAGNHSVGHAAERALMALWNWWSDKQTVSFAVLLHQLRESTLPQYADLHVVVARLLSIVEPK